MGKHKAKAERKRKKYNKAIYVYEFKSCSHTNSVKQSIPNWSGKVCTRCNIITDGPYT